MDREKIHTFLKVEKEGNLREEGLKEGRRVGHLSWAAEADVLWLHASHWKPAQGCLPNDNCCGHMSREPL